MKIDEKIIEAVKKAAVGEAGEKKISCKRLFTIAEETGTKHSVLGKTCDREGIRITACQLGCFE